VEEVKEDIDAVILLHKWEESLVILKDLICMEWIDIISVSEHVTLEKDSLSTRALFELQKLLEPEYILYNFFLDFQAKKVKQYGLDRLKFQVKLFERESENLLHNCQPVMEIKANKQGVLQHQAHFENKSQECRFLRGSIGVKPYVENLIKHSQSLSMKRNL